MINQLKDKVRFIDIVCTGKFDTRMNTFCFPVCQSIVEMINH